MCHLLILEIFLISEILKIVKLLLSKHKDLVDQKDARGKTALHLVAMNNFPIIIDDLVDAKSRVRYLKDDIGVTALHIAAFKGHIDVMKKLLERYPEICGIYEMMGIEIYYMTLP